MKFSAAGGWFGTDYCNTYREAARYGFRGVEILGWKGVDFESARKVMDETGTTQTAIVMQSYDKGISDKIDWSHGMVWEDSREAFINSFLESVEAAKKLRCPNIIATTGNERSDVSRDVQHEIVVETLKCLAPVAEENDIMIILEPLNAIVDHKGHYLNRSDEAFEMIREIGSPNVKVLFDIYHQQITEGNLIANITANIDLIGHFHIADVPGRREPGTGEINYRNVFEAIRKTGYDKWLAFECGKSVDTETLCRNMRALVDEFDR